VSRAASRTGGSNRSHSHTSNTRRRHAGFASPRTRADAEKWQKALRTKVTELIGGFPAERPPLRPITLETRTFPGYVREKIVFDSRPGVSVLAYLLLPDKAQRPAPS
jgi:Abhydrolase family